VLRHEAEHLASVDTSGAFALDKLLGTTSLALLWYAFELAQLHGTRIKGRRFENLRVEGPPAVQGLIQNVFRYASELQRLMDRVYLPVKPLAELQAIDYSASTDARREELAEIVIKEAGRGKPESYENRLRRIWNAVREVQPAELRREFLLAAMSFSGSINFKTRRFKLEDPLTAVEGAVERLKEAEGDWANQWRRLLRVTQVSRTHASLVARGIRREILRDLPRAVDNMLYIADSTRLSRATVQIPRGENNLSNLVRRDAPFFLAFYEQRRTVEVNGFLAYKGANYPPLLFAPLPRYDYYDPPIPDPLLDFELIVDVVLDMQSDGEVEYDPPISPLDWWKWLALLETLRLRLKSGQPIVCPFRGWTIELRGWSGREDERPRGFKPYVVVCGQDCTIRQWLIRTSAVSDLVAVDAVCN